MSEARRAAPAVVILTRDEELNLPRALDSVAGWAEEIHVLDSFSTDKTVEIARSYGARVERHGFEDYARQRNYALEKLPIRAEWILFLDADEQLTPELKAEISARLESMPRENGFYLNRRFIWMGRWIRRGYYPTWILRLFRRGKGRCEDRAVNEHIVVEGEAARLTNDFNHEDLRGVGHWIAKHDDYARREALELLKSAESAKGEIPARFFGGQAERKRWLRLRVWNNLPPLLRPFLYFFYRYVLRGGFLDGGEALVYHVLQALWYPLLIDVHYLELRRK
jgi:glycosyltransferase involved in cell wall biosynthesis